MKRKLLYLIVVAIASTFSFHASGQLSGYYQESFEGTFPPTGWQTIDVEDTLNVWEQSAVEPYSGSMSAHINYSAVGVLGDDWLILPQFSAVATDSFSFWMAADFVGYPPDSTFIMVSTTDTDPSSFTALKKLIEGVNYPTTQDVYKYYHYSLAAYAGEDIYVALRNVNVYGDGLYFDLVTIGTMVNTSVTAVSIDVPPYVGTDEYSPMATVKNSSLTDQQSFPVTLTITGGYSSTVQVDNLDAGSSQQITFDPWTPTPGQATLTLETELATDENTNDDSISKTIDVYETFTNYGWTSRAITPTPIWDEGLASVNGGSGFSSLYTLAGVSDFTLVPEAMKYDPASDSWITLTSMTLENYTSCAAAINDRIYVIGGYNPPFTGIGNNQIYDIGTDTWSSGTEIPYFVGDYGLGVYHDSLLYFFGGYDGNMLTDYATVQIYDPLNDVWTSGTDVPANGYGWQAGISGNKIVLFGGTDIISGAVKATTYVGTINTSNPADITWTQVEDNPAGPAFRPGGAASTDPASGLVIFTAGDPDGSATSALQSTFAYDVNSGSWKIGPDKPTAVNNLRNLTCVEYKDSLYLVSVGGLDAASLETSVNEWLNLGPVGFGVGVNAIEPMDVSISSYPNPFTKSTLLTFTLPNAADVVVTIVDVTGKEIQEIFNKNLSAGTQQVKWNASGFAAGVYFARISVNDQITTEKLVKLN